MTALPTRFPCWCRAIYSWGGETDKDLGFVEGDLIECLNAGDGSWWTGRLRRDRRSVGIFPSNFVKVLDESFVPVNRSISPMPSRVNSDAKEKQKEQAKRRKPFQGYKSAQAPGSSSKPSTPQKVASSQQTTPAYDSRNPPSTVLWQQPRTRMGRASPMPEDEFNSPPPPPPPHRTGNISRAASPAPYQFQERISRTPSPNLAAMQGHTPPMIRDAMEDVMSSLEGMSFSGHERQPSNPWTPEAFDDFRQQRPGPRPLTSLGLGPGGSSYTEEARERYSSRHNSPERYIDGPPHLETYVQRMERHLEERARQREGSEDVGPTPPPKSGWNSKSIGRRLSLRRRKSAYDLSGLDRTNTTKTSSTNSSSGINSLVSDVSGVSSRTSQSVFSGYSAGGFSATSAGSLARKRNGYGEFEVAPLARPMTSNGLRSERPKTPQTGYSYHSSHDSRAGAHSAVGFESRPTSSAGLSTSKTKKTGLLRKFNETVKTSFASARSTIAPNGSESGSPPKHTFNNGITSIAGGISSPKRSPVKSTTSHSYYGIDAAKEMGLDTDGAGADWLRTRRDLNRSNTPGPTERRERADRCQMLNEPVICSVDELYESIQGDEDANGQPVDSPFVLNNPSFAQIDKAARYVTSLPSSITTASLATGYLCRPYRSDVQRLRAIFIWCAERITWSDDYETPYRERESRVDTRRVLMHKSGSSQEVAAVVMEMCRAIGLDSKIIQGYLKRPGEELDLDAATITKANHYWNSVLVDGEWRMIDSSLASPTNPHRNRYSSVSPNIAEAWYFLTRPSELCWTHIPLDPDQQYFVPPISSDTLLALPGACPPFFRLGLSMHGYDTSLTKLDGLEMATICVNAPFDTEVYAEVETQTYCQDHDGDVYENPDSISKIRVLAQPQWYRIADSELMQKRYVVKAILPGDERIGTLKIYAGKKGLMHSAKDMVHPLAMALPLTHSGENPRYEFVRRHPTPHATRQDLYIIQPQCYRLGLGERYVFYVRQHAAHMPGTPATEQNGFDFGRPSSPNPFIRPGSAMSMTSSAAGSSQQGSESAYNATSGFKVKDKPAKLAIQSPSGKIFRMTRKPDGWPQPGAAREMDGEILGTVWEAALKTAERGTWRGLVLADRSARWCVWGEWECA